jgi:hypothetical protein
VAITRVVCTVLLCIVFNQRKAESGNGIGALHLNEVDVLQTSRAVNVVAYIVPNHNILSAQVHAVPIKPLEVVGVDQVAISVKI